VVDLVALTGRRGDQLLDLACCCGDLEALAGRRGDLEALAGCRGDLEALAGCRGDLVALVGRRGDIAANLAHPEDGWKKFFDFANKINTFVVVPVLAFALGYMVFGNNS
jgi:hypothetical protein